MKKKLSQKEKEKFLRENWSKLTNPELARKTGLSITSITRWARRLKLPQKVGGGHNRMIVDPEIPLKDKIFQLLLKTKKHFPIEELSDKFNIGVSKIREAIAELRDENKNFEFHDEGLEIKSIIDKSAPSIIDKRHLVGQRFKFGFVTDNHLGSRYERLDVLNAVYDRFLMEGITEVYNAGNVIDGEARFNKFDIHTYGMQNQCEYFAQKYPKRPNMKTFFITGDDHEGWYVQREGVNIGKLMEHIAQEHGREDLVYLGHMEHDIVFKTKGGQSIMRIVHPGGGSSYAFSYTSQKLVESYSPGEKPHILLMGHYHKACYDYIRGVHTVQGGCTMDQSPFMRKKRLEAHVGGWIIEVQQGENGVIQSFKCEWIPFYGKNFYDSEELWNYQYKIKTTA